MTKCGLTLPNRQWETMTPEEEAAILDLKPQAILVIGYPDSPVLAEKIAQEARLWEALGKPQFILRVYGENIMGKNPGEWAEDCYRLLSQYEKAHVQVDDLAFLNEPNHPGERGQL